MTPRVGTVSDTLGLIRDLSFDGATGALGDGPTWTIEHRRGAAIRCRYNVDPGRRDFGWEHTHHPITTPRFFHGVGSAFLIAPAAGPGQPAKYEVGLRWELPEGWTAVSSFGLGRHVGAELEAADLRQSVYLAGTLAIHPPHEKAERPVTAAIVDGVGFDVDAFSHTAADIVAQQCEFMDEKQFPPFLVTAVPVGPAIQGGDTQMVGVGLHQSFALWISPQSQITDGVEHLLAHELFHYWNGRLLKAKDPEKLAYWFVEGFTDYYALRILFESGHWSADTYAKWINRHIREYLANPAIHATNEQIRDRYWGDRDTIGEVAYQRGLLLGIRWHRGARDRGVAAGVDRLFRALVDRARKGRFEYTNEDIRRIGVELYGPWFGEEFDRLVVRAETVEVPHNALEPELTGGFETDYTYELGFDRERSLKDQRVRGLVPGSAAEKAGLREGDDLLGWQILVDTAKKTTLQVRRGNQARNIEYFPRAAGKKMLQFHPASRPAKP